MTLGELMNKYNVAGRKKMNSVYEIGNVIEFVYNGETHRIRIEKVKKSAGNDFVGPCATLITGWDYLVDLPIGGYRSFTVSKIKDLEIVS